MKKAFFETIHSASSEFPYFDSNMRNIEYLPHFHRETEIVLVKQGEVDIICENKYFTALTGDVCVFLPGEIHSFASAMPNHLYIAKIHSENAEEPIDFSAIRLSHNLFSVGSRINGILSEGLARLHDEIARKQIGYAYRANGVANGMVGDILRYGGATEIEPEEQKRHRYAVELLENVNAFIEAHYRDPIYLEDAAQACNLSKYYFSHLFKSITASTFHEYLTRFRLDKASQLLGSTDKKMVEIALDCGFSGTRAFNRDFARVFKMTPSKFRTSYEPHRQGDQNSQEI